MSENGAKTIPLASCVEVSVFLSSRVLLQKAIISRYANACINKKERKKKQTNICMLHTQYNISLTVLEEYSKQKVVNFAEKGNYITEVLTMCQLARHTKWVHDSVPQEEGVMRSLARDIIGKQLCVEKFALFHHK